MKTALGYCILGVDYSVPPTQHTPSMLANASNILPNDKGLAVGRLGSVKLNADALSSRVTSFFEHTSDVGVKTKLVSYADTVSFFDPALGIFQPLLTGLTPGKMLQWVNFGGKAVCVNEGFGVPQQVTSTASYGALAGSPPTGAVIAEWGNRVYFGCMADHPGRIIGCALNNIEDYTTTGATGYVSEIVGDDSDPITGMVGFFDWLLVGKKNNLYRVTGNPSTDATSISITPVFSKTGDNIGFTSPWAITQVGTDLIFLDGFDIKSLAKIQSTGDIETASIIPHFSDYLREVADEHYLKYTQFFHYKKKQQIWVSVPTSATTHFVFVLDYRFRASTDRFSFFPLAGLSAVCFGGVDSGSTADIYFGDESGFVRKLDTGYSDDGTAISSFLVTSVSGNAPATSTSVAETTFHERRKQFGPLEMFIQPDTTNLILDFSYAVDLMDDTSVRNGSFIPVSTEDVSGWDGTGVKSKRIPLFGVAGRTLALKVAHNTLNENFTLHPSNVQWAVKTKVHIV